MVIASIYALGALAAGISIPLLFLILALMNAAVALFIFKLVPEFIMRLMVWLLVHLLYRVDKSNFDQVPEQGPAVLICNHVSFVDALVLAGCIRRPIRFVMYYRIFQIPLLSFIFRAANAIPIAAAHENPDLMEKAFDKISQSLRDGEVVCIFPEGKITEDGALNEFKPGVVKILERDPVPVIPFALNGLWGGFFSRAHGNAMSKPFARGLFNRIELRSGPALAANSSLQDMQQAVAALRHHE